MALIRSFLILFILFSCGSNKDQATEKGLPPPRINCPEGGNCSFEVLQNSSLVLKKDEFGKTYPVIEKGTKNVIRYHFEKNSQADDLDGQYSEYVLFEIDPDRVELAIRDKELQKVKMTFGRICYCKGSMGYFPVTEGQLFIYQNKGNLQLRTKFKMRKVPQIVDEIDEKLTFYPKK